MKFYRIIFFAVCLMCAFSSYAQKSLSEGSLVYTISVETGSAEPKMADMLDGATTTVYLKGNMSRTEMISGLGSEATIHNAATGNGVILKEYSGQKLMITLTPQDWQKNNLKSGITYHGSYLLNQTQTSNSIVSDEILSYKKGNTIYLLPYKQKIFIPQYTQSEGYKLIIRSRK